MRRLKFGHRLVSYVDLKHHLTRMAGGNSFPIILATIGRWMHVTNKSERFKNIVFGIVRLALAMALSVSYRLGGTTTNVLGLLVILRSAGLDLLDRHAFFLSAERFWTCTTGDGQSSFVASYHLA